MRNIATLLLLTLLSACGGGGTSSGGGGAPTPGLRPELPNTNKIVHDVKACSAILGCAPPNGVTHVDRDEALRIGGEIFYNGVLVHEDVHHKQRAEGRPFNECEAYTAELRYLEANHPDKNLVERVRQQTGGHCK